MKSYQAAAETGDYSNREVSGCDCISTFLSIVFPCSICCAFYTLQENTSNVILRWGKYAGHDIVPGGLEFSVSFLSFFFTQSLMKKFIVPTRADAASSPFRPSKSVMTCAT